MEQQDYLKKQIDQLGQVLAQLLGDILGLKNQGKKSECISLVDKTLENELDINLSGLKEIPKDKIIATLQKGENVNIENLDRLAEIIHAVAVEEQDIELKNKYLEHSLTILEYIEQNDTTYSITRHQRMTNIKNNIKLGQ